VLGLSRLRAPLTPALSPRRSGLPDLRTIEAELGQARVRMGRGSAGAVPRPPSLLPRAADAVVDEAGARHLVGAVDVAQVDDHRLRHRLLEAVEIERAKKLPFGDD